MAACGDDDRRGDSSSGDSDDTTGGNAGSSSSSSSDFCYDLDCNGDKTGNRCFESHDAYCSSLCAESNCLAADLCDADCH
jgi:hypothetical protein